MMRKLPFLAATVALLATPALAQIDLGRPIAGWTYFHKAGADMAAHDAAVLDCVDQAMRAPEWVSLGQAESSYHFLGAANPPAPMPTAAKLADNRAQSANVEN